MLNKVQKAKFLKNGIDSLLTHDDSAKRQNSYKVAAMWPFSKNFVPSKILLSLGIVA